mgnify:CR=1 FL=1
MTSPFLTQLAQRLDRDGVTVHRFNFPYMAERASGGRRRPAPRAETLTAVYRSALAACLESLPKGAALFIGGKSMGGRVACLAAGEAGIPDAVAGFVLVGYPFHPAGKPQRLRLAPLMQLPRPVLIVQGTRDPLGTKEEIASYELPGTIGMVWIEDGDHDLRPRASSGSTHEAALRSTSAAIARFIKQGAGRQTR